MVMTLEDVLDAYVASGAGPNSASLAEWICRYPRYERELTEFAASWSLMRSLPPAPDAKEVDEEALVLRGMSVVQDLLRRQAAPERQAQPDYLLQVRAAGIEARREARWKAALEILLEIGQSQMREEELPW